VTYTLIENQTSQAKIHHEAGLLHAGFLLCCLLKLNQHFRRICRLHLQDQRMSQVRNQHEAVSMQLATCLMLASS
jgi:hypothetical protein